MLDDNIKMFKSIREDLVEGRERASKLLDKYGEIAYGPNVDYNSEEAQDADVIHDALCLYLDHNSEQQFHLNKQIAHVMARKEKEANDGNQTGNTKEEL